ncbi:MAG: polyprenol monophosphomannose synthase [Lentisphaerae bacterium]|nr:polyprenol monophosphomannose synthase [Lentisphaerota bacterium]MCP4101079.1 polyprenol monophosphomannose synthase [Lentisphaerota bacterium]
MNESVKYGVVIPTLNEVNNIVPLVKKIQGCGLENLEIIVVDENSPDGTCQAVNDFAGDNPLVKGVLNDGIRGLSPSIVKGFRLAQGEFLACMDGDLQHDVNDLPKLLKRLENTDFVIGSRYVEGGGFKEKWNPFRVLASKTAALMAKIIFGVKVKDPMSGFFAVRKEAFEYVAPKLSPKGFKIMLELVFRLNHSDRAFIVKEEGITFGLRQHGKSKLNSKVIIDYIFMLMALRKTV